MNFKERYEKVQWIVRRCARDYYVHLWESSDWEQEGMLVYHQLEERHPDISQDESRLYRYFKTKFRNHIHDILRKQESQKRRFDRQCYEEVSTISHRLSKRELALDDLVALRSSLAAYTSKLDKEQLELYHRLLGDERFKGRKRLLRELEEYLSDFSSTVI